MVLYYEEIDNLLIVGITGVDLTTGRSFIYENASSKSDPQYTLDETYRLITIYNPCEILILSDKLNDNTKKQILNIINNNSLIHPKWDDYELSSNIKKIDYQNKILEKSFINKSMLSIIEYLNLEKYSLGRLSFCCLLQLAYEHNNEIIQNVKIIEENILKKLDIQNKIPQYKIYEQIKCGNIKIFNEINKNTCSFILKISGIWETFNNYGITYKFITINN
jgi:DNA mismatch repair protein MutS